MSRNCAVSIVIPALNKERFVGHCLQSLALQDFPKDSFEVVFVDNGSTDRTLEVARSFSSSLNLTVLRKPGVWVSAVRNFGAAAARGDILIFLDCDCAVPPQWLKTATNLLARDGAGVLGAHFRVPEESSWVARSWYEGMDAERQGDLAWVPGCDMIMTRATFERIGGFDESIQTNEDCELCERVRAAGLRVVGDAAVAVVHLDNPQTLVQFYRKDLWRATDGLRVFLRSLPKITNPRPILFGAYTLICLLGFAIGAVLAFRSGRPAAPAFFVAALMAPAALLSMRLAARRGKWGYLIPLTLLHAAFGLARAHALLAAAWRAGRRGS